MEEHQILAEAVHLKAARVGHDRRSIVTEIKRSIEALSQRE
jgi:hypothetical protein